MVPTIRVLSIYTKIEELIHEEIHLDVANPMWIFENILIRNDNRKKKLIQWIEQTFRYASHTRIISCNSLPSGVVFGTISQKINSNFLIVWFCDGITNRMMVINRPGKRSPFNSNLMTVFKVSICLFSSPCSIMIKCNENYNSFDLNWMFQSKTYLNLSWFFVHCKYLTIQVYWWWYSIGIRREPFSLWFLFFQFISHSHKLDQRKSKCSFWNTTNLMMTKL